MPTATPAATPAIFTIVTKSLRDGVDGLPYSMTLNAAGGKAPYQWSLTSGALPSGLAFQPQGLISGIPIGSPGTMSLSFSVSDATRGTGAAYGTLSLNIRAATAPDGVPGQFTSFLIDSNDYAAGFSTPTMPLEGTTLAASSWNTVIRRIAYPPNGNCPSSGNVNNSCTAVINGVPSSIVPDYSKKLATNLDGSLLLLLQGRGAWYHLYDAHTYQWQRRISDFANPPNEVTWSKTDAHILFYKSGMALRAYNVSTHLDTLVHDFASTCSSCTTILDGDEGNQSEDDRFWAFFATDSGANVLQAMVYDKQQDKVISQVPIATLCGGSCPPPSPGNPLSPVNWIGMSPKGDFVVVNWNKDQSLQSEYIAHTGTGTELFSPSTLNFLGELSPSNSHADVGYDVNGNEVYVGFWGESGLQLDGWTLRIRRLDTLAETTVVLPESFNRNPNPPNNQWEKYYHISMRATRGAARGWMLMSIYQPNGDATVGKGWGGNELVAVKIDVSAPQNTIWRRLGRHYSIRNNDYFAEPHAVPTLTFDKVFFGSNWMNVGGPDYPFVLELP